MSTTPIKIIEKRISETGLPCDPDTERAAISCMLIDQTCIELALNQDIDETHFYDTRYAIIFNELVNIKYHDGSNVDLVLLKNKLRNIDTFKNYSDRDISLFLMELEEQPVLPSNFYHYIDILEDFKKRRVLILDSVKSVQDAYNLSIPILTNYQYSRRHIPKISAKQLAAYAVSRIEIWPISCLYVNPLLEVICLNGGCLTI